MSGSPQEDSGVSTTRPWQAWTGNAKAPSTQRCRKPFRLSDLMPTRRHSRSPSHEGLHGFHASGRSSGSGVNLGGAPSREHLAVAALLPFVIPHSGGAAPDLHRVPYSDRESDHQRMSNEASLDSSRNVSLKMFPNTAKSAPAPWEMGRSKST